MEILYRGAQGTHCYCIGYQQGRALPMLYFLDNAFKYQKPGTGYLYFVLCGFPLISIMSRWG